MGVVVGQTCAWFRIILPNPSYLNNLISRRSRLISLAQFSFFLAEISGAVSPAACFADFTLAGFLLPFFKIKISRPDHYGMK